MCTYEYQHPPCVLVSTGGHRDHHLEHRGAEPSRQHEAGAFDHLGGDRAVPDHVAIPQLVLQEVRSMPPTDQPSPAFLLASLSIAHRRVFGRAASGLCGSGFNRIQGTVLGSIYGLAVMEWLGLSTRLELLASLTVWVFLCGSVPLPHKRTQKQPLSCSNAMSSLAANAPGLCPHTPPSKNPIQSRHLP